MSSSKNLIINSDESVLWTKEPRSIPIMVVGLIWTVFIIGLITFVFKYLPLSANLMVVMYFLVGVASALHFWFVSTRTKYIITDKRLVVYDGGIRPVTTSIPRNEISDIKVQSSITESLLNTGRITLKTEEDNIITLSSLANVNSLLNRINDHIPDGKVEKSDGASIQVKGVTWPRSFAD